MMKSSFTILPPLVWLVVIVGAVLLVGCATTDEPKVCFVRVMGQTEDGWYVEAQRCMSPEAFAESQK